MINTFKKDLLELLDLLEIQSYSDHGAKDLPTLPYLLFIWYIQVWRLSWEEIYEAWPKEHGIQLLAISA